MAKKKKTDTMFLAIIIIVAIVALYFLLPKEPECTPEFRYECYSNNLYWYDSCGERGDKKEDCGTQGCEDDVCVSCLPAHDSYLCHKDDLYWFDACDNVKDKKTECEYGCEENSKECNESTKIDISIKVLLESIRDIFR